VTHNTQRFSLESGITTPHDFNREITGEFQRALCFLHRHIIEQAVGNYPRVQCRLLIHPDRTASNSATEDRPISGLTNEYIR